MTTSTSPADYSRTTTPRNLRTSARPSEEPPTAPTSHFPPPETFDFLAPLHELLSRLLAARNPTTSSLTNGEEGPSQGQQEREQESGHANLSPSQQRQHQQQSQQTVTSSASLHSGSSASSYPNQQPLSIQQLAAEVSTVRARVRNARRAVEALPDVDRSIEEQEREMGELNARIDALKDVLEHLGAVGDASIGG